jgi:putative transposase
MLMKRQIIKRTPAEKERILLDIQRLGIIIGCRKYNLAKGQYYEWLNRYNALGIEGLEDRRGKNLDHQVKRLEKENSMLKELLAEKELEMKMKDELLKKKIAHWNKGGTS